ncbi:hypothetical protein [Kocuria carniphila]|uniref:hypothetical protein n=1 Tax=Kocuria carniphila TaxID=262208 RepID=UPI0034CF2810
MAEPTPEPHEYIVEAPRDAEADVLEALARFGVWASTIVPGARGAGTVRVSRVGGDLTNQQQRDRPLMLIEVWEETSPAAFDAALRAWSVFRTLENEGFLIPGVALHNVDLQVPRALDDELAPDLCRVQFTVEMTIPLTEITLTEEI